MKIMNFISILGVTAGIIGSYYTYKQYLIAKKDNNLTKKIILSHPSNLEKNISRWKKLTEKEKTYDEALYSCEQLGENWRLPTKEEIKRLATECNPKKCPKKIISFNKEYFPYTYWTINLDKDDGSEGYVFNFNSFIKNPSKENQFYDLINTTIKKQYICIQGDLK